MAFVDKGRRKVGAQTACACPTPRQELDGMSKGGAIAVVAIITFNLHPLKSALRSACEPAAYPVTPCHDSVMIGAWGNCVLRALLLQFVVLDECQVLVVVGSLCVANELQSSMLL